MKRWLWMLRAATLVLMGCSHPGQNVSTPAPTAAEQASIVAYGGAGQLSNQEWGRLRSLAWPQDYRDMKGTFGFPAWRNSSADVYTLPDGAEVWIFYEGQKATRYELR